MTIDKLMEKLNCTQWPQNWRDIYDDALPEDTSLFRALKNHCKSGKAIYEASGYILV